MKFLKYCSEDDEEELTEEHIDYCIGSAQDICKFIEHIGKELGLGSSAQLGYLQAITDLIDFRKSSGLSATVLWNLAVSEVYINRGKRALARRKLTEWSKNLSVEVLAATNQWATMDEMEKVIPFHLPQYKVTLSNCKGYPMTSFTAADLAFATRFVVVYLFTRVLYSHCANPLRAREHKTILQNVLFVILKKQHTAKTKNRPYPPPSVAARSTLFAK